MTTQILPRILALAPRGFDGLNVAAAACRARALGIIDLCADSDADVSAVSARVSRLTAQPFALRVLATELQSQLWLSQQIGGLAAICVVLGGALVEALAERVEAIKRHDRIAIAEVSTREEIRQAIGSGFSALVVAGTEARGTCGDESSLVLLHAALAEGPLPVWVRGGIGPAVAAEYVVAGAAGVVLDDALLMARETAIEGQASPVSQYAELADRLARKYVTVGGIVQATELAIDQGIAAALGCGAVGRIGAGCP